MRRIALWVVAMAAMTAAPTVAPAAPNGAAIIKKATEAMRKAKTYQADWQVIVSAGSMGGMTLKMAMKTTSDGRTFITTEPAGPGTGMIAASAAAATSTTVSDGKTMLTYMKAMNGYLRMPVPKGMDPAGNQFAGLQLPGSTYKLLAPEFVRGRKCDVVEVVPKTPPGAGPGMKMRMRAFVDQQTGRLRQMKRTMSMSGMPGGPSGGANGSRPSGGSMEMTTTMVLISEKVNAPIPASVFKWRPPAGAKEMKGGMMGGPGMGGRPGGP
jgi:outer membrane lipoprotein-sorting protein